jgi:hypothetical protein
MIRYRAMVADADSLEGVADAIGSHGVTADVLVRVNHG